MIIQANRAKGPTEPGLLCRNTRCQSDKTTEQLLFQQRNAWPHPDVLIHTSTYVHTLHKGTSPLICLSPLWTMETSNRASSCLHATVYLFKLRDTHPSQGPMRAFVGSVHSSRAPQQGSERVLAPSPATRTFFFPINV